MEHQTLDRWLRHFGIFYTDKTVSLNEVREAVAKGKELNGPGKLLGKRAESLRAVVESSHAFARSD